MEKRIQNLLEQMTLEEKASLCSGTDFWHLKGIERLQIPSVMVSDGPHGLRKQDLQADHLGINESISAVCFPPAVLQACSFDRELLAKMGEAIGQEAQAQEVSIVLGPAVNMKRSPLCGRNFEYYSEDPYLAGECGTAYVKGVESQNIGTSVKHFAANNQEWNRMSNSSEVDERTLREIYLSAFEKIVKEAKAATLMCSYNKINGIYASENKWLLNDVLREEWGFKGYVMSDWGAVDDRVAGLKAGLDLEMPSSNGYNDQLIVQAVKNHELSEEVLNQACARILKEVFRYVDHKQPGTFDLEKDHQLAKTIAQESIVLLKNEGAVLPLQPTEKIAFIGEFFENPRYQGGGSSHINASKVSSGQTVLADWLKKGEIQAETIAYAPGFSATNDQIDTKKVQAALELAQKCEKIVVFAGLPESYESEGYDRKHMQLPQVQNDLIAKLAQFHKPLIVVLHNGAPVELPWKEQVAGIVEAYLAGQAGAEAIMDILYGKVNPSGKLAETFPVKLADNPSYLNFAEDEKTIYHEELFIGYRYYDKKEMPVAYPFGHGLSYTTFEYSNLRLSQKKLKDTDELTVWVDVKNTGLLPGKEIVQLYVSDQTQTIKRPIKELKQFAKVSLDPGETKTVTMTLDKRSFAYYETRLHDWYAPSGKYQIFIGASSQDIRCQAELSFQSSQALPLHLHLNSTLGELLKDTRSQALGQKLKEQMDVYFGSTPTAEDEETDAMGEAIAQSMPIRNIVMFGIMTKEELLQKLAELNG